MIPYFDAHCDTITTCLDSGQALFENSYHIDLLRAQKFTPYAQIFAIWIDDDTRGAAAQERFWQAYAFFIAQLKENAGRLSLCTGAKTYENAIESGVPAAFLAVEGGQGLGGDICQVEKLYTAGVRLMTLTWNGENELGYGCMCPEAKGLKPFGRQVLTEMNRLHMLIDVSHLNEAGFWDVMETGEAIVASHSNAKAICDHKRNLTDAQFSALMKAGGGVGINLYAPFVGENPTVDTLINHIEHFWGLNGEDCLFIGADFDGIDTPVKGFSQIGDMENLYERLLQKNYSENLLHKLFYENLQRIMTKAPV